MSNMVENEEVVVTPETTEWPEYSEAENPEKPFETVEHFLSLKQALKIADDSLRDLKREARQRHKGEMKMLDAAGVQAHASLKAQFGYVHPGINVNAKPVELLPETVVTDEEEQVIFDDLATTATEDQAAETTQE